MFKIEVKIDRAMARMNRLPGYILKPLGAEARVLGRALRDSARAKASAQISSLKYSQAIRSSTRMNRFGVTGKVRSIDPVQHILEGGASIPRHLIELKNKKALRFLNMLNIKLSSSDWNAYAARVHHPVAKIAARPAISAAGAEMQDEIRNGFNDALVDGIRSEQAAS